MELLKKVDKKEKPFVAWTREQEELLAEWSEKLHVIDGYIVGLKKI